MFGCRDRGLTLGSVMLMMAVLVTLGFSLAGLSVSHIQLLNRASHSRQAENLARSVAAQALERVLVSPANTFGQGDETLTISLANQPGVGRLSFSTSDPDIPQSTNNIQSTNSVNGAFNTIVPGGGLHLVGVGESGGVVETVELVYQVPAFPYAIAAAGPISANAGLVVSGLPEGALSAPPDLAALLPADVHSNASGDQAIHLSPNSQIGGDVQAVGRVFIDPADASSITIRGELREGTSQVAIPGFDPLPYDPAIDGRSFEAFDSSPYTGAVDVAGVARSGGDLAVVGGGLNLDGAALFVAGDLVLDGPITGHGLVVVLGDATIGAGDFAVDDRVALLSKGHVSITGSLPSQSFFQGMIQTEAGFAGQRVTLIGSLIAGGTEADPVTLNDVRVFRPSDGGRLSLDIDSGSGGTPPTEPLDFDVSHQVPPWSIIRLTGTYHPDTSSLRQMVWYQGSRPVLDEPLRLEGTLNYSIAGILTSVFRMPPRVAADYGVALDAKIRAAIDNSDGNGGGGTESVEIDPAGVLSIEERIRLLLWRVR